MPLPGSSLPRNFRWADRSLILFADWPDLKEVFDADLLDVLAADATEQDKARYPRKWVLNAEADGLLLPDIGGRFSRDWRPQQSDDAGARPGRGRGTRFGILRGRHISAQVRETTGEGCCIKLQIVFRAAPKPEAHITQTRLWILQPAIPI